MLMGRRSFGTTPHGGAHRGKVKKEMIGVGDPEAPGVLGRKAVSGPATNHLGTRKNIGDVDLGLIRAVHDRGAHRRCMESPRGAKNGHAAENEAFRPLRGQVPNAIGHRARGDKCPNPRAHLV